MRILHVTPSYWPAIVYGGPSVSVTQLCRFQSEMQHEVFVMTTTANGKEDLPYKNKSIVSDSGVTVQYFRRHTGDHSHFTPTLLWQLFRRCRQFDIVHIHSWWNLVAIPSVFICCLLGVRPFFSPRGMLSAYSLSTPIRRIFHKTIGKWLLGNTILHATSLHEMALAQAYIHQWPGFILPNIIELPRAEESPVKLDQPAFRPFTLVFLGRLHPIKRIEMLFESLANITLPWRLNIAGEGEMTYVQSLQKLAKALEIDSRIVWHGWVAGNAKTHLLEDSDLFIMISHNENFSNAVLEALAVGTPALVTESVGMADYIRQKKLGWICDPNSNAISGKIQEIISGKQSLAYNRQNIMQQVRTDFNGLTLAKQYIAAYREYTKQTEHREQ